ncbi:G-protein coupled receptor Mth2-like isoform X3 [Coccinella septempunctata]|uniref:G-protein coupled receptor Mth2-like isoform X3 n=1 Tax=Coccinella septempunctata TaxID=41139 RepID=UPI001D08793A|nr:G-protein coupled receptor Mth2-like isoform X3 [Coccinella septempunctata]
MYTLIALPIAVNCDESYCFKMHKKGRDVVSRNGYLFEGNSTLPVQDDDFVNCLCKFRTCISKCCGVGEILNFGMCNQSNDVLDIRSYMWNEASVGYLFRRRNVDGFVLDPKEDPSVTFKFMKNGDIVLPYLTDTDQIVYGVDEYCVDIFKDENINYEVKVLLSPSPRMEEVEEIEKDMKRMGMIISMPFLLVTFLVYALLPDRNLHMKALMCYVINLLHAYIFLVTIQLTDEVFEDTVCAILGYCCVFFFLASFFWMNVICVDIFLGFRGFRGVPGVRSSERKRFILYCIYAWGMSLLIVFITFMVNHFGNVGQWFYPGVAVGQCFIRNGIPQLLYFYGPMGIIIILNVVLFTLTAMRIRRVKKDTAMLKHSESKRHSDDDQQNFNLYLKLLLAMGVNWSMELVSWAVNLNNKAVPQYVWYLSDFCNATYGVFIFFIFVFKRNIWKQLRRRYYSFMGRHHMAHSMGTTNFTKTTNDSMTVSTNDRALEESELNGTRIN